MTSDIQNEKITNDVADNIITRKQLNQFIKDTRNLINVLGDNWSYYSKVYNLTDEHMMKLFHYNVKNRADPPEDKESPEAKEYDAYNGLQHIKEEDVIKIFGLGHVVIGDTHEDTVDRLTEVAPQYFEWKKALRELQETHDLYIDLVEAEQDAEMEKLRELAETEENAFKRATMLDMVEEHYSNKYLYFLTDHLSESDTNRLIKLYNSSEQTINYLLEKVMRRLSQLNITSRFIAILHQFEKRFLDVKYHCQNNVFLLYFASIIRHADIYDKNSPARSKIICIIFTMDRFVRNSLSPEHRERVLNNIMIFEDQFIGKLSDEPKEFNITE